jgi:diguanylate cyclase (GGDEF)-like protein
LWASDRAPASRVRNPFVILLVSTPDIMFCVGLVYGLGPSSLYLLLTGLGAASSFTLYCGFQRREDRFPKYAKAAYVAAVHEIQFALILRGDLNAALNWLLCWHFLAVAITFFFGSTRRGIGVWFTAICFVAWAAVFPIGLAVMTWLPDVHVAPGVWNLPKYLVATGMLVVLLEEQMYKFEHASLHDALTNIPNRRLLVQELSAAAGRARSGRFAFTLMIIDIDLFKQINDCLGHVAGDEVLRQIAARLRGCLRQHDVLTRIGGDEFAALLFGIDERETARRITGEIESVFRQPFVIEGREYLISVSIGHALSPAEGTDTKVLYALADQRMYDSKLKSREAPRATEAGDLAGGWQSAPGP